MPQELRFLSHLWNLEFQVGSCLYVTAAVQAGLTPQRGQSDRSTLEVHWNLSHSQVHTQRLHSNEAGP